MCSPLVTSMIADLCLELGHPSRDFAGPPRTVPLPVLHAMHPAHAVHFSGHAIECGWFLLDYARSVGDDSLQALALQIIDWSFDAGWDPVHGGIFYFLDAKGFSPGAVL